MATPKQSVTDPEIILPAFTILLQGLAAHSVKGDAEQYRQFRAKMQKVMDLDGIRDYAAELTMKAEIAINFFQHYSARTSEYFQSQSSELLAAIDLLVGTLADLAVAQPEYLNHLREIAHQMHAGGDGADIRQRNVELAQCIADIRQAAERGLHSHPDAAGRDPVTDLERRAAAEAALVEACSSQTPSCVVVLQMDRLPLYTRRYGRNVGDKALRFFADTVKRFFACEGSLYQWAASVLVMLRPGPVDKVLPEVRRALESRLQFDCETSSRHLLLSIDAIWWALPMMVDPRLLVNKIDSLVGG